MFQTNIQTNTPHPPYVEQLVVSVVDGLQQLADILPYEFDETIGTIEGLYALKFPNPWDKPLTKEQLRNTTICPRHHVFLVQENYKDVDGDKVCPKCEDELKEQSDSRTAGKSVIEKMPQDVFDRWISDGDMEGQE